MSKTKIFFVTGAAGFVGRHVCELLTSSGYQVRALTRSIDTELMQSGVKLWKGDLWDKNVLREAISGTDIIIHCAGNARFGNGPHYQKENVELTAHLISAVEQWAFGARFVFVSTIGAVDRGSDDTCASPLTENSATFPTSDYGRSKLQAEELVRLSSLSYSIIRPTMVVGGDMRLDSHFSVFARRSLANSPFARLSWPGRFSVVHVKDLANAILTISTNQKAIGETFFCAGDAVSIGEFFELCSPDAKRLSLPLLPGLAKRFIKQIPFTLKAMLLPALTASDEKLRALGWLPNYSARSALAEVINREKCRIDLDISPGGQTVITGAASGLGRALAVYLSSRRDRVLLVDKDRSTLEELAALLPNSKISVVDLAEEGEIDALLASSNWREVEITELFACAGIGLRGQMQEISLEDHRKMFAVNVLARITLGKEAISGMRKRHFGRVILISSSSAFQPLPYMATYAGSNSALLSIGEAWAIEVSGDGVQVMTVCPGGMQTNFQKSGGVKQVKGEKLMLPEQVAEEIITGLRSKQNTLIVSFRSYAMSMLARLLPRGVSAKLWGRLMEKMR